MTVIVRGELDLDSGERLLPDLLRALSGSADGIDLQLSEVAFCDCSGINLMLELRRLALRYGKTVTVAASSPAVDRLFDLTAVRYLFEPSESSGLETGHEPDDEVGHDGERGAPAALEPEATAATAKPPVLPPGAT
ncbi:STAS domain-containing protein [Streptomyces sp. NPDC050147]|uniref:STAS domain-containing protein n=1 Tax=Streptomyces sp. NPDC050147 TaxID=3155513 RepID=UPI003440C1E0